MCEGFQQKKNKDFAVQAATQAAATILQDSLVRIVFYDAAEAGDINPDQIDNSLDLVILVREASGRQREHLAKALNDISRTFGVMVSQAIYTQEEHDSDEQVRLLIAGGREPECPHAGPQAQPGSPCSILH